MTRVKLLTVLALGMTSAAFSQRRPRIDGDLLKTTESEFDVVVVYHDDDDDNSRRGRAEKVEASAARTFGTMLQLE